MRCLDCLESSCDCLRGTRALVAVSVLVAGLVGASLSLASVRVQLAATANHSLALPSARARSTFAAVVKAGRCCWSDGRSRVVTGCTGKGASALLLFFVVWAASVSRWNKWEDFWAAGMWISSAAAAAVGASGSRTEAGSAGVSRKRKVVTDRERMNAMVS